MNADSALIDTLTADYYEWLSGHNDADPKAVLQTLTHRQRALFLREVDRINMLWSLTANARDLDARRALTREDLSPIS